MGKYCHYKLNNYLISQFTLYDQTMKLTDYRLCFIIEIHYATQTKSDSPVYRSNRKEKYIADLTLLKYALLDLGTPHCLKSCFIQLCDNCDNNLHQSVVIGK